MNGGLTVGSGTLCQSRMVVQRPPQGGAPCDPRFRSSRSPPGAALPSSLRSEHEVLATGASVPGAQDARVRANKLEKTNHLSISPSMLDAWVVITRSRE